MKTYNRAVGRVQKGQHLMAFEAFHLPKRVCGEQVDRLMACVRIFSNRESYFYGWAGSEEALEWLGSRE